MFVDEVEIDVLAGSGGNGMATFRKEKYVPRGGPNGGDGGHGGSVVLQADSNLNTLLDLRYHRQYKADRGRDGGSKDMFGQNGRDLVLRVPPGVVVTDLATGAVIADLSDPDARVVVARGGIGGRGNAHFVNSVHQAPHFAERGEPGEHRSLRLELKLLADVGLLGYPNVGKSTLIAAVSAARPRIADYPFTTLVPNLGVVYVEQERSFVMADIPGLIEGASEGVGLGYQFLRHVERTRLLIHVLDVSGMTGREPLQDFAVLNRELARYNDSLAHLPQIVALNKIDVAVDPDALDTLEQELRSREYPVFRISAATRAGLQALVYAVMGRLEALRAETPPPSEKISITAPIQEDDQRWEALRVDANTFTVTGRSIERMVAMTDLDNYEALRRLQRTLDRIGVTRRLKLLGAQDGHTVSIRGIEFEYEDEDREEESSSAETRRRRR